MWKIVAWFAGALVAWNIVSTVASENPAAVRVVVIAVVIIGAVWLLARLGGSAPGIGTPSVDYGYSRKTDKARQLRAELLASTETNAELERRAAMSEAEERAAAMRDAARAANLDGGRWT